MKTNVAFALLLALSFALYANSFGGDFVFDDDLTFHRNGIQEESLSELLDTYRPLRYLSYRIDEAIFDGKVWGYHVFNALYHGLTSFVVFLVLRRLAGPGAALAGALLFAAHPAHTECVAYMSGRRDLLSTLLYLLGFLCWLEFNRTSRRLWLATGVVAYALALGVKEMAVTLPAVCVLHDVILEPARARQRLRIYAVGGVLAASAAIYIVFFYGATHSTWHGASPGADVALSARLAAHYAALLVFPLRLLGDYSYDAYPLSRSLAEGPALLSLAAIAGGVWAALYARRRAPLVAFGLGWFLITLTPVLQIAPFHEIGADRHDYLPSIGFCLLAGLGFERLRACARPRLAWGALGIVLLAFSARTVVRNRDWRDSETFWRATIETAPRCARAHFNYGTTFATRGQSELKEVVDHPTEENTQKGFALMREAAVHMGRAVEIKPDYIEARVKLGTVYKILGREADARAQWEEALRLAKPMKLPPFDPGAICMLLGRYEEAIQIYDQRLQTGQRPEVTLHGLMICHKYLGSRAMVEKHPDVATVEFHKALRAAEQLLLRKPNDRALLRETAELAEWMGDRRRAADLRARASRAGPSGR